MTPPMTDDLVGRLREMRDVGDVSKSFPMNPDGDEAAARIEALEGENRAAGRNLYHMQEASAAIAKDNSRLREALSTFLIEYVALVDSGDAGFWDAEKEPKVIAARAALAKDKSDG